MQLKDFSPYSKDPDALKAFHFERNIGTVEDPVYVYDSYQEDDSNPDIEAGALKILKKKVFDGVAFLAVRTDKIQIWWKKDGDATPVLVAEAELVGQVWSDSQWQDRMFSFDGANLTKVQDSHYRAFRVEDIPALSIVDAVWGLDVWWEAGNVKLAFYADVPDELIRIIWQVRVMDSAVAWIDFTDPDNPIGHKGLSFSVKDYVGESSHTSGDDPETGWTWHRWIFEPNGFQVPIADGRTPSERFTGTFDENGQQLTERAGLYIDPYLIVDDQSTYHDVYCDGYVLRFEIGDDPHCITLYDPDAVGTTVWGQINFQIDISSTIYRLNFHDDTIYELIENTPTRVVFRFMGNFDSTYGGGNPLTNSTSAEIYVYVYPDRIFCDSVWITSGNLTFQVDDYGGGFPIWSPFGANLTSETAYYENSGSESACSDYTNYNSADYVLMTATEINVQLLTLYQTTETPDDMQYHGESAGLSLGWINGTMASGTHLISTCVIFDSPDREGSAKIYNSTDRIAMGNQYADTTLADPTKGSWADDLLLPANIGVDGFAGDGAHHIDLDSNDEAKLTIDITRIRPNIVIKDWPFHTGTVASPTDHLLCHLKLNENAASSNLNDETANNADGTWSNISDGTGRNTNTSGDSVQEIGRGRNLDTQNNQGYIEMAVGSSTVHDNDFFKKGSILIKIKPNFAYTIGGYANVFRIYYDSTNYIALLYYSDTDSFIMAIGWGGTLNDISGSAYTDNYSLQREMTFLCSWDSDKDFYILGLDGQVMAIGTNTGTPTTNQPTNFRIAADHNRGSMDLILDDIKTFDDVILPYGAFHIGNGQGLLADIDNPHKNLLWYFDGQAALAKGGADLATDKNPTNTVGQFVTTDPLFGTNHWDANAGNSYLTITLDSNTFNGAKGFVAGWFNFQTDPNLDYVFYIDGSGSNSIYLRAGSDGNLDVFAQFDGTLETITDIINPVINLWYFIVVTWDVDGKIHCYINGEEHRPPQDIAGTWTGGTAPTLHIGSTSTPDGYCDMFCQAFWIGNDPLTPQIWTAFGKPLHMPLVDKA